MINTRGGHLCREVRTGLGWVMMTLLMLVLVLIVGRTEIEDIGLVGVENEEEGRGSVFEK